MAIRKSHLPRIRTASQILFFLLFLLLLLKTEFRGVLGQQGQQIRLPYPVKLFFDLDPLIALLNALSTHALYGGLILSLVILVPTMFFGRFFCGWICPLGSLNHFFSSLRSDEKIGVKLIQSQRYKKWQAWKYYILIIGLVLALLGSDLLGVLDPISLTVRSFALSVLPALNLGATAFIDALYRTNFLPFRLTADALQAVLGATILSFKQVYFRQAVLVGFLFFLILAANFGVTRFWCRALCPLGALLGLLSRWSVWGWRKNRQAAPTAICV